MPVNGTANEKNLPDVSDEEIKPPEPVVPISELPDNSGNVWKGIASWLMIISGAALIIHVIALNRKIPRDSDNRYHGGQNIKSSKSDRKTYYKTIRRKR